MADLAEGDCLTTDNLQREPVFQQRVISNRGAYYDATPNCQLLVALRDTLSRMPRIARPEIIPTSAKVARREWELINLP